MIKKILVLTDFSGYAYEALKTAVDISKRASAEVILVHIVPSITSAVLIGSKSQAEASIEAQYMDYIKQSAEAQLAKLQREVRFEGASIRPLVLTGDLFKTTKDLAQKELIDLMIMGTKGAGGLDEILVGSNTEKVVRYAEVPVLSLKQVKGDAFAPKSIIFATTLQENQKNSLKKIQSLQKIFGAHLHLLFVNTPSGFLNNDEVNARKETLLKGLDLSDYTMVNYSAFNEEAGILRYAQEIDADLIAMATHQRKGLSHFFLGSLTEDVVNHAERPVLSMPIE